MSTTTSPLSRTGAGDAHNPIPDR